MFFGELFWETKYLENTEMEEHTTNYSSLTHIKYVKNQQIKQKKEIEIISELLSNELCLNNHIFIQNIKKLLEYCYKLTPSNNPSYTGLIKLFSYTNV